MEVAAAGLPGPLGADAAPTSHQDTSGLLGGVFVSSGMPTISISNFTCMAFYEISLHKTVDYGPTLWCLIKDML